RPINLSHAGFKFNTLTTPLSYKLHSEAIYTSRLLHTSNLPLPVNAPDFEKQFKKLRSNDIFEGNYHFVLKFVLIKLYNYFHTNLLIIEFKFLEHDSKQVDFTIPDGNYHILLIYVKMIIFITFLY